MAINARSCLWCRSGEHMSLFPLQQGQSPAAPCAPPALSIPLMPSVLLVPLTYSAKENFEVSNPDDSDTSLIQRQIAGHLTLSAEDIHG